MENDIKDITKKIEEARKRQEKIERIIIFLVGFLVLLVSSIVGINVYYSGGKTEVSNPKVIVQEPPPSTKVAETSKKTVLKQENSAKVNVNKNKEVEKAQTSKNNTLISKQIKKEEKDIKTKSLAVKKTIKKETKEKKAIVKQQNKKNIKKKAIHKLYYTIQVAAFKSHKNAQQFVKKLHLKSTFIKQEAGFYRVFVGKFESYKEAVKTLKNLPVKGFIRKIKL